MNATTKMDLCREADVDRLIKMRLGHIRYVPGHDRDDLVQEGWAAAWEALDAYDPERGKPSTYLSRAIRNAYLTLLARATRQKRRPDAPPEQGDAVDLVPSGEPTIEDAAVAAERARGIRLAIERTRRQLGSAEGEVMDCYMEPPPELLVAIRNMGRRKVSKRAIARYLDTTPDRLQTLIRRIHSELSTATAEVDR